MRGKETTSRSASAGRIPAFVNLMRLWLSLALAATLLVSAAGFTSTPAAAQAESTPDAVDEGASEEPNATAADEEEADGDTSGSNATERQGSAGPSQDMSLSPGYPAVLAQGLAYVPGDDMVWTVREFDVPALDDASGESGRAAIFLQRQGGTIIRNDVTGKRARLEAGEAFFRAPDDSYTSSADGSNSTMWSFELVAADDVADDAFYEGPLVKDLEEATYDLEMTRFILQPGDSLDLPAYTGTGITMGLSGEIEVTPGSDDVPTLLREGDGKTLGANDDGTRVANSGSSAAMFVFVSLGEEVSDETAGAGTANQATAVPTEAPSTEEQPAETTTDTDTATNALQTTINVTALAEIYVTITVDGTVAYDGYLESGQSTGPIAGSLFQVQTSSGANTSFTNACGTTFNMGYEEGDAYYELAATPDSCAA